METIPYKMENLLVVKVANEVLFKGRRAVGKEEYRSSQHRMDVAGEQKY